REWTSIGRARWWGGSRGEVGERGRPRHRACRGNESPDRQCAPVKPVGLVVAALMLVDETEGDDGRGDRPGTRAPGLLSDCHRAPCGLLRFGVARERPQGIGDGYQRGGILLMLLADARLAGGCGFLSPVECASIVACRREVAIALLCRADLGRLRQGRRRPATGHEQPDQYPAETHGHDVPRHTLIA